MRLDSLLKGTSIKYEAVQTINGLTILPLVCEAQYSLEGKYGNPLTDFVIDTRGGYGVVQITNNTDKPVVVMPHSAFIVDKPVQDHMISKGVVVKGRSRKILNDSRCVQSTQHGHIEPSRDKVRQVMTPLVLREVAFEKVGIGGAGALWPNITSFNKSVKATADAQLKLYFQKHDAALTDFIAHFERLENCIGFITMFDGEIVGIDKFPSFTYTAQVWDTVVRDAYASLVIHKMMNGGVTPPVTGIRLKGCADPITLAKRIYEMADAGGRKVYQERLEEIMEVEFTKGGDGILTSEGYIGQVIEDDGFNVLVSVIKRDKFNPEKYRESRAMRNLAKSQAKFKL